MNDYANNRFELADAWKILIGNNPNGGLWYLWTLFFMSIISLLVGVILTRKKGNTKCIIFALIGIVSYVVWLLIVHEYSFLEYPGRIVRYAVYYNIGLILQCK